MAKYQSKATQKVKAANATKVGSGFAPGSRPGVITSSGNNVFKDGKLVGSYNDKAKAQAAVSEFTSRGQNGRITNIQGDRGGETYRQLNTVNKGTQTGRANTGGIKSAVQSRGFVSEVGVDEQGNERVIGAQTPQGIRNIQASEARAKATQDKALRDSQTAYVAGQPFSRQAPVLREQVKEEEAKARIAAERGIDTKTASGGQLMRLNEAVNLDVYGNAAPKFGTGADVLSTTQKMQEKIIAGKKQTKFAIPENLKTGIDSSVVTSTGAQEYTDSQIAQFQDYNQDNSDTVTSSLDSLMTSDPDILAAEAAGDDMQALLASRQAFYEEQYNSLQEEIAAIYDSKEADYKEQAAVAMGSAIAQMAAMGSFGTTTAGMQYVDGVGRKNDAAIMALASEEASALNQAYSSFMEADFAVAEEMLTNAQATRTEIRSIKAEQLTRQKQMMELRQMEREELGSTMEMIAKAGMTSEDMPEGYLDYLDSKFGYPSGTSSALFDVAAKEQTELDETAQLESMNTVLDITSKLPPTEYIEYDGNRYYGSKTTTEVIGTEIDKATGNIVTITRNTEDGSITTQISRGVLTPNVAYSIQTDGDGNLWYVPDDPTQGSAVPVTGSQTGGAQGVNDGAIQQAFPAGMTYAEAVKEDPTLTQSDFWCLRFIGNMDVRGDDFINSVGDTIDEKAAAADPTITVDNARIGDYILTNEDTMYGHIALINDIRIDPTTGKKVAVLTESNYKPLTVGHTRTIELSSDNISGSGGRIMGFIHSQLKPEYTSQAPVASEQLSTESVGDSSFETPEAVAQAIMNGSLTLADIGTTDGRREAVGLALGELRETALANDDFAGYLQSTAGGKDVGETFLTGMEKSIIVLDQLGELQAEISDEDTGPILGILRSNNPYDVQAQQIKAQLASIIPNLARGVYGEVGVLTDADIANYARTLPNLTSEEELRNAILSMTLKTVSRGVEAKLKNQASAGRDVSGYIDLYTSLMERSDSLLTQVSSSPQTTDQGTSSSTSTMDSIWSSLFNF